MVGESGSGKSTLARLAMALERPTSGAVRLLGEDLNALSPKRCAGRGSTSRWCSRTRTARSTRGRRWHASSASRSVAQGAGDAATQRRRVGETLEAVGLRAADLDKYPHEFSGGQRQRIAIARALVTRPKLIVADEPVSALDVSVQAQVLNLLLDLQAEFGITYLLISHDLAVVDHVCDEVAVIYLGRIVEQGRPEALFHAAAHPYTRALLDAVPRAEPGAARRRRATVAAVPSGSQIGDPRGAAARLRICRPLPACAVRAASSRCRCCATLPRDTARRAIMPSA